MTTEMIGPTPYLKSLSFELAFETTKTTKPPKKMPKKARRLQNRFEEKDSKLLNISIESHGVRRWDKDKHDFGECDLEEKGFIGSKITLHNSWKNDGKVISETVSTITNEVGYFTCAEVIDHILDFEKCDRPKTKWFGGINCHHRYFEGLWEVKGSGGHYGVCWGS